MFHSVFDKRDLINAWRRASYRKNKEDADENKEPLKAPRRGGYRKKNEDAANKHLHENGPALNISGTSIVYYSTTTIVYTPFVANYMIVIGR